MKKYHRYIRRIRDVYFPEMNTVTFKINSKSVEKKVLVLSEKQYGKTPPRN